MTFNEELEMFYLDEGREDVRLEKDSPHYLEYLTAIKYMDKFLKPESKILDSCAGSGIYAFRLAELGHTVTAGDVVAHNVDAINQKQAETGALEKIYLGDARDLSRFEDASFDAVLCMGALYHLPDSVDRKKVLDESVRVISGGGIFICTYMNRHAVILNNSSGSLDNIDEVLSYAKSGVEGIFYASTPEEAAEMAASCGLHTLAHVALDGMNCFMSQTTGLLNKKGAERWRRYHFASCEIPSLLGYSYHNMLIATR